MCGTYIHVTHTGTGTAVLNDSRAPPHLRTGAGTVHGPWCPYFARMLRNRRITASSHFQDTRHIELDLGDSGLSYVPGTVGKPGLSHKNVDAVYKLF